jgi:hypothetical protein
MKRSYRRLSLDGMRFCSLGVDLADGVEAMLCDLATSSARGGREGTACCAAQRFSTASSIGFIASQTTTRLAHGISTGGLYRTAISHTHTYICTRALCYGPVKAENMG